MRISRLLPLLAPALAAIAQPAAASLIVSGDNFLLSVDDQPGNAQFLLNLIANPGGPLVLLHPGQYSGITTNRVIDVLNDAGSSYIELAYNAQIIPELLADSRLYISYGNATGWTAGEAQALRDFVRNGGHVLLAGDNYTSSDVNAAINDLTAAMGSDLTIVDDALGPYPGVAATILEDNALTAGTAGLIYVASSHVTGGNGLYGVPRSALRIIAYDDLSGAVPEPASWALMILGFGLVGQSLRRQREGSAAVRAVTA